MPSIVNSLVGKTGVKGGLHEFSAPGTGIRGERCVLAEFIRESIPEFSPKEKMVITGARHGMAEGGRTVAKRMECSRRSGENIGLASFMKPFLSLSISALLPWAFRLMDIWSPLLYFKCLRNKDAATSLAFHEIPKRSRHY